MTSLSDNTPSPSKTSLLDFAAGAPEPEAPTRLETLRLSEEPAFVSLFTTDVEQEQVHWLGETDAFEKGYYRCNGAGCPACAAQIRRSSNLLLPVLDRTDGRVKVLRVSDRRGPGQLLTELAKVLGAEDASRLVTQITRGRDYKYTVTTRSEMDLDPDAARAIKRYADAVDAGELDIRDVSLGIPDEEMAKHEKIAKVLSLMGTAQ